MNVHTSTHLEAYFPNGTELTGTDPVTLHFYPRTDLVHAELIVLRDLGATVTVLEEL